MSIVRPIVWVYDPPMAFVVNKVEKNKYGKWRFQNPKARVIRTSLWLGTTDRRPKSWNE